MSQAISETIPVASATTARHPWLNRWLVWKEIRLLVPLIASVVIAAFLICILDALLSEQLLAGSLRSRNELTLLLIPGLFATGAGLVLVGHEREQQTMDWLISLPLSPRQLILTKFAVAAIGLVLMWLIAGIGIEFLGASTHHFSRWRLTDFNGTANSLTPISFPIWTAHSAFVLFASFYVSWRIANQFLAIIALVVLACIPMFATPALVTPATTEWLGYSLLEAESIGWLSSSLMLMLVMLALSYRQGIKVLSPQSAPWRVTARLGRSAAGPSADPASPDQEQSLGWSRWWDKPVAIPPRFGSESATLIWQSVRSSRVVLAVLSIVLLTNMCIVLGVGSHHLPADSTVAISIMSSLLAISWLGVLVFKADGHWTRIRYLADRGISPAKVYAARHAAPVAILTTVLVLYTWLATFVVTHQGPSDVRVLPSLAGLALAIAVIYSVSQWVSQLVRTVTLSVILAPVLSVLALAWFSYTYFQLGASLLTVLVGAALPIAATFFLMPRYMDARERPLALAWGSAVIAAILIPPLWASPSSISGQSMRRSQRMTLLEEGRTAARPIAKVKKLTINYFNADDYHASLSGDWDIPEANEMVKHRSTTPEEFLVELGELQADPSTAAELDVTTWQLLHQRLMYQRLVFEQAHATGEVSEQQVQQLARWIKATLEITASLRRSVRWQDQELADRLEIWMVDTMTSDPLREFHDEVWFQSTAVQIPDRTQRAQSRRRAILASWSKFVLSGPNTRALEQLGGIAVADESRPVVEGTVLAGLAAAESEVGPWREQMHALFVGPVVPFDRGPYSDQYRALPPLMVIPANPPLASETVLPARFWNLPWEQQAESLKRAALRAGNTRPAAEESRP